MTASAAGSKVVAEPVDAATVLLVRDAPARGSKSLEVLMVQRHQDLEFAGGMLVFPGGKVMDMDRELPPDRWRGPSLEAWSSALHVDDHALALGLVTAAVRETFEEAGLLMATRSDGEHLSAADLRRSNMVEARRRLNDRSDLWDWRPWLEEEDLVLDLGALTFWSWWITPSRSPRRFDTRFFLAHVPESQIAEHDDGEITGTRWWEPSEALEAHAQKRARLMYPTRCNLHELIAFECSDAAVTGARGRSVDRCRIWPRG